LEGKNNGRKEYWKEKREIGRVVEGRIEGRRGRERKWVGRMGGQYKGTGKVVIRRR
jgi:hypothetical protein